MKHFFPWLWIIFICLLTGCSESGWTDRSGPVGVMYLDGKELRENGFSNLVLGGVCGKLSLYRSGEKYYFQYDPRSLSNRMNTLKASLHLFCINDISLEAFDDRKFIYSKGDNKYEPYLLVNNKGNEDVYEINSATVFISDIYSIYSSQDEDGILNIRIDYTMDVVDSEGKSHKVEGWAKYDDLRTR